MPTQIPPTILAQILQTKSSQETIVALLNEAEVTHSRLQRGLATKREYPCWRICPVCGKTFWRPASYYKKVKTPTCSKHCNGMLRGQEWAAHGHKGREGWTDESRASYAQKMSGPNNPAWKGGVTYFRKHGNYPPIKYVRCPEEYLGMARKDGYVMEHRLIVAQHLGRCLKRSEVVHHIDHDPTNNDAANLMLFSSNTAHKRYEARGQPAPLWRL